MLICSRHLYVYDLSEIINIIDKKSIYMVDVKLYIEELVMDFLVNDLGFICYNYIPSSLYKYVDSVNYKFLKDIIYKNMIVGYAEVPIAKVYDVKINVYDMGIVKINMETTK